MQFATRKMAPLCLASGLLAMTLASALGAEPSAGVTRIAKPRQAAAPVSVQQAGFSDWVDNAADRLDTFNERVYGAPEPTQPQEPVRFPRFGGRRDALVSESTVITDPNGVVISQPADGVVMGDPYSAIGYRDDWRTHQWDGECRNSRFRARMQSHSMAMENGYCKLCGKDPHHHHLYYHDCSGRDMLGYFHSKFGYFCPSGAGGAGSPFFGKYARVYPQDVNYFDGRDGQLFAAQGYGAPMAVPLAPVVGHTYNYGWGIPSSRLTPISHPALR
jgi:hypothetical protein